jgi:hypothetical protein
MGLRMDAERLVVVSRHALDGSTEALEIVAEAWQAQALAQAIGHRLALSGPRELRAEARELCEGALPGCRLPEGTGLGTDGIRARQLSAVSDVRAALEGLGALLADVGVALVAVACATDEEAMYWQCIEAIDAADESNDRVAAMVRRLVTQERERERGRERARDREEERMWPWEWRPECEWDGTSGVARERGGAADSPVGPL